MNRTFQEPTQRQRWVGKLRVRHCSLLCEESSELNQLISVYVLRLQKWEIFARNSVSGVFYAIKVSTVLSQFPQVHPGIIP
jgi:hypothetical protein